MTDDTKPKRGRKPRDFTFYEALESPLDPREIQELRQRRDAEDEQFMRDLGYEP